MDKRTLLSLLGRLAFAHELVGDPRAAKAYGSAIWTLRQVDGDLREMHASGALAKVRGVGKSVLRVADAVFAEGGPSEPEELAAMEAEIPAGLREVAKLRGLGPKKVRQLWAELGITTLAELEYACSENRLVDLKGFGAKSQAKVLAAIAEARANEGLLRRDQAKLVLDAVVKSLADAGVAAHVVGAYRRGCEVVDALELVAVAAAAAVAAALPNAIVDGDVVARKVSGTPLRVFCCAAARLGTELVLRTGPEDHVAALTARGGGSLPIAGDEAALYAALDLSPTPPERRDAGAPLYVRGRARPELIRREDLVGALHNHTTASDGMHSIEAMRAAAAARGLAYLGISEHSRAASYAGGLEIDALLAQLERIAALNAEGHACTLLTGIESDILADGALDYAPETLRRLDLVIASVHNRHGQRGEAMTLRMVAAAENPWTDVIGHPTGRLLLGRAPSDFEVVAMLDACAASGCAVELNASPQRLDLHERHLSMAKERGILVSIAADAHSAEALDHLDYGISIARRAGLTPADVLNCKPLDELRAWLRARKERAAAALGA
ncbi:MAG: helix-hairpin-helix domain-containing protein [Nannocystaceae bacterium]